MSWRMYGLYFAIAMLVFLGITCWGQQKAWEKQNMKIESLFRREGS